MVFPSTRTEQNIDLRDLLIAQQVRRVDELERQVDMLEAMLHNKRKDDESSAASTPEPPVSSESALSVSPGVQPGIAGDV